MEKIALPQKIEFVKGSKANNKQIIIEPCYPGYGTTIGNALRRVLLSSLPGAAVIGVKIKGADHEFMTLPHVKEDVLELILNLKKLRLKVFSDEVVKLELDARGEKEVKASDIKKNSLVQIANPDLILGHITDMAGSLSMEIFVSQGVGYITVESREGAKNEIGYIEMDSIFSPIFSVSVNIENVRIGKMTNWDKLILNLTTDGTITPEDAFHKSVEILINQFDALIGRTGEEEVKEIKNQSKEIVEIKQEAGEDKKSKKRGRPKKS
ncbi:DNA-directed RNA polymerase subunit alpha [Patescibacteria group bacterium]|nr:DNA-directed RNA polymerase subunit alpha [Patescibacteria group bacterium]MBU2233516.1 DNA-directed RNA polymerase subunit alpha [Patescibacteria group bacterium]MBU2263819.1 DNA-directed RNA polymerase subunit alpha [Patescibacteria group bacterium]